MAMKCGNCRETELHIAACLSVELPHRGRVSDQHRHSARKWRQPAYTLACGVEWRIEKQITSERRQGEQTRGRGAPPKPDRDCPRWTARFRTLVHSWCPIRPSAIRSAGVRRIARRSYAHIAWFKTLLTRDQYRAKQRV